MPSRSAAGSRPRRNSSVAGAGVLAGPLDGRRGGLREGGDVEPAEHRQVVVADQAEVAALADQLRAGVGLGAVADDVAEAPELLDAGFVDRRENGLEGGLVGVDVAEDGYAQAASVPWGCRGPYDWPVTATDSIAELRGAVDRAARALRDGERDRAGALPRPAAEARAGRLQLQRRDAAGGAAGRQPARRRRAPARGAGARAGRLRQPRPGRGRRPRLRQPLPLRRLVPARPARGWSRRGRASARPRPRARSGSWSSSSPPTRPARCTSAAAATPPTATPWCGCWRRSATRSSASTTSTTPAARSAASPTRSPPG